MPEDRAPAVPSGVDGPSDKTVPQHSIGPAARAEAPRGSRRAPRVVHIITRLIRGGADENTIFTANGLREMGYDCGLICGRASDPRQVSRLSGVETVVMPTLVRRISPALDLRALLGLTLELRRMAPEIVHTHTAKAGVLGRLAARLAGVPVLIHGLHGTSFHPGQTAVVSGAIIGIERMMAAWTDLFMSVSDELSELYAGSGIGCEGQFVTVRSGMDLEALRAASGWGDRRIRRKRRELGLPPELPVALLISRLEPRKRVHRFIEAAAELAREGIGASFAIAGEGPLQAGLEEYARGLQVADSVFFLGFREDIPEVLAAATAVCVTSAWEGLPRVFVEASVVGRMVVCYEVNGAREVITDGENGYVAPQGDARMFCRRLGEVLGRPVRRGRRCLRLGRDPVGRWSVEAMVAETAEVYERLLKQTERAEQVLLPERGRWRAAREGARQAGAVAEYQVASS